MTCDMYPNSSEGHFVLRHYGGPGTRAMCWIVHRDIIGLLGTVKWRNRAGALVFAQNPKDKGALNFCCIGTHGCHDGDTSGSLGEIVELVKTYGQVKHLLMVGDWNIDLLPTIPGEPWCDEPDRLVRHACERVMLEALCDSVKAQIHIPLPCETSTVLVPISRHPVGCQDAYQSLLDYGAGTAGTILSSQLDDRFRPADHSWVVTTVDIKTQKTNSRKRGWKCKHEHDAYEWLVANPPMSNNDLDSMCEVLRNFQEQWAETSTCSQRSHNRMPQHVRDLFEKAAHLTGPGQADQLRTEAVRYLKIQAAAQI